MSGLEKAEETQNKNDASSNSVDIKGEHWKGRWTHPYTLFILLNIGLALLLVLLGWMAVRFGWLPKTF